MILYILAGLAAVALSKAQNKIVVGDNLASGSLNSSPTNTKTVPTGEAGDTKGFIAASDSPLNSYRLPVEGIVSRYGSNAILGVRRKIVTEHPSYNGEKDVVQRPTFFETDPVKFDFKRTAEKTVKKVVKKPVGLGRGFAQDSIHGSGGGFLGGGGGGISGGHGRPSNQ